MSIYLLMKRVHYLYCYTYSRWLTQFISLNCSEIELVAMLDRCYQHTDSIDRIVPADARCYRLGQT